MKFYFTLSWLSIWGALSYGSSDLSSVGPQYVDWVASSYETVLADAKNLQVKIKEFTKNPSQSTQAAAKEAWKKARQSYSPTEAFRFYAGPIDDAESGVEALMNAWPIDESYIDYTKENSKSGIINNAPNFKTISKTTLIEANEKDGERNVSTGFHAIEFLLWGQDFDLESDGKRSFEDYIPSKNINASRRAQYLEATVDLLVEHSLYLANAWKKNAKYPLAFVKEKPEEVLRRILTGMTSLASDEMAGERMTVALEKRDQENEQDCFSDYTLNDLIANQKGIIGIYEKAGIEKAFESKNKDLNKKIRTQLQTSLKFLQAIPAPMDKIVMQQKKTLSQGKMTLAIESLQKQSQLIAEMAKKYGVHLNVE